MIEFKLFKHLRFSVITASMRGEAKKKKKAGIGGGSNVGGGDLDSKEVIITSTINQNGISLINFKLIKIFMCVYIYLFLYYLLKACPHIINNTV